MENKLKPCPFCGTPAWPVDAAVYEDEETKDWNVMCSDRQACCFTLYGLKDRDSAIRAWNTRYIGGQVATKEQIEAAYKAYLREDARDMSSTRCMEVAIEAATAPLLQEIAALKGALRLEDLPPESERTKLDEWQACYASLFRQMQEVIAQQAPLLDAVREAYKALEDVQFAMRDQMPLPEFECCRVDTALAKLKTFME